MADLEIIQQTLDRKVSIDDIKEVERKLLDCINLLGASSKLKADAHKTLFNARESIIDKYPDTKVAMLKLYIDSQTAEEQADFILAERLNVSLAKAIDGLKAIMNIKEEESVNW